MRRVLVLAAHPDDEILGCGGTIKKLTSRFNSEVHVLIMTDGSSGQYRNERELKHITKQKKEEAYRANELLGVKKVDILNLPDMRLDTVSHIKINEIIERKISEFKPSVVFTHDKDDINLDHELIYKSTLVATRPLVGQSVKSIYAYTPLFNDVWGDYPNSRNYYVDISETMKDKMAAMEVYKTELRDSPHPRSIEGIKLISNSEGMKVGLEYAESFRIVRELL